MNSSEHILRKRALYTGLQPFLKDSELMEALILWETSYSDQPKYSLRYFISDLSKSVKKESEAKKMLIHLVSTMSRPEKELLPDPTSALNAYKIRRAKGQPRLPQAPELQAFKLLIDKWLWLLNSPAAIDIGYFVMQNIDRITIDEELRRQVKQWLKEPKYQFSLSQVNTGELRKLINLFYVAFCEYVGPVQTDELLNESVKRLKSNGGAAFSTLFAKLL